MKLPALFVMTAVAVFGTSLVAQRPTPYRVEGGARDGVSVFDRTSYSQIRPLVEGEVDFKHFHTYEEATALLKKWASAHPDLVELYAVGQSLEGREIWQITITNRKTGRHTDKPAMFIEGGRHAGEISGIEATLYFINYVLTNYGKDPAITALLDTKTIYAKPHNNPDGASLYHYTAQTLRSSVRPTDNDDDGLKTRTRVKTSTATASYGRCASSLAPARATPSIDDRDKPGRLMRRVPQGQGDYVLYGEGIDNDNDGRINEDGIGGLDLHRNYPENWRPMDENTGRGWTQFGAGEYPLSEPETRAVFSFLMAHPNVAIVHRSTPRCR